MFHSLLILQAMADVGGVGVSMTALDRWIEKNGYALSRYKMRAILKDLQSVGAVGRNKNHFFLRLLGHNLAVSDKAAAIGHEVFSVETFGSEPEYQLELI